MEFSWRPEGDLNSHDRLGSADFKSPPALLLIPEMPMFSGPRASRAVWPVRFGDGRLGPIGHGTGHSLAAAGCGSHPTRRSHVKYQPPTKHVLYAICRRRPPRARAGNPLRLSYRHPWRKEADAAECSVFVFAPFANSGPVTVGARDDADDDGFKSVFTFYSRGVERE